MAESELKLQERYTYRQYREWPDDERWELIDGVPYAMLPAPSRRHLDIFVEMGRQFANFLLDIFGSEQTINVAILAGCEIDLEPVFRE